MMVSGTNLYGVQGLKRSGVVCPVNASKGEAPLTCPPNSTCCRQPTTPVCKTGAGCSVCAECCHDEMKDPATCSACVKKSCPPNSIGKWGCSLQENGYCCTGGQDIEPNSQPNCLIVGDSVAHGTYAHIVMNNMSTKCNLANVEDVDAYHENMCFWSTGSSSKTGLPLKWNVIHYNEGLHSLWPRINTTEEQSEWANQLGVFTKLLQATGAKLIYGTMTPFMPEKYLNPNVSSPGEPLTPRNDVEYKNALAVKTVQALGVNVIDDLYTAITDICGKEYRNCSLCDDESAFHPQGECGYHYVDPGWQVLALQTMKYIDEALTRM